MRRNSIYRHACMALALLCVTAGWAQTGSTGWYTLGSDLGDDSATVICPAQGGGWLVAGRRELSAEADDNAYLVRLNNAMEVVWDVATGQANDDIINGLVQLDSGRIVIAGTVGATTQTTTSEAVLAAYTTDGEREWTLILEGDANEEIADLDKTSDGNLLFARNAWSDTDTTATIVKIDPDGTVLWAVDSPQISMAVDAVELAGGGYLLCSYGMKFDPANGSFASNLYLLHVSTDGTAGALYTYTDADAMITREMIALADGNLALTGVTNAFSADPKIVIKKITPQGQGIWTLTDGGDSWDEGKCLIQNTQGDLLVAYEIQPFREEHQLGLLCIDAAAAQVKWEQYYGKLDNDRVHALAQAPDGGYVLAGHTEDEAKQTTQILLIKTDALGNGPAAEERAWATEWSSYQ